MIAKLLKGLALSAALIIVPAEAGIGQQYNDKAADQEIRENMPAEAEKYLDGDSDESNWIGKIIEAIPDIVRDELKDGIKEVSIIVIISALCAAARPMAMDFGSEKALNIAAVVSATAAAAGGIKSVINLGIDTALELSDWSALVLPVMTAASAAAGNVTSAAAKYAAAAMGMSIASRIASRYAIPLIYGYISLSVGAAAFGGGTIKAAAKLVKCAVKWVLTLATAALTAYLVLSGATAASVDAVAAKSVKTALGTLPIVGSIASDAASAVLAGGAVIRNSAGLLGVVGVLAICVGPVVKLASRILLFKASGALATAFDGGIGPLLDDFASALSMSLGTCGLAALLLFFSLVSSMQVAAL